MQEHLAACIEEAIKAAKEKAPSREMSLIITKLEEAQLWYSAWVRAKPSASCAPGEAGARGAGCAGTRYVLHPARHRGLQRMRLDSARARCARRAGRRCAGRWGVKQVAALFVAPDGPYVGLEGVDPWDEERDARLYPGPHPVVAHPPCSRWSMLAPLIQSRYGYRIGDDGGCFASALSTVRKWGGVLEHPAGSRAWSKFQLPRPLDAGWSRTLFDPGWVCEVSQAAYGHRAAKKTWLYCISESEPQNLDWSRPTPSALVSFLTNHRARLGLPRLSKREASATPPAFRDVLLEIARSAR